MKTIHLVWNAHLDPIWLWPWEAGLDEALATCRSACDRLDAHPDLFFTRGEAWVYQQVERCDPALFERIRAHVQSGRWEIAGGWWIQPDCNLPSGWGLEKQIELGRAYFEERFGIFPRYAMNVDSFGHAATLPGVLAAAGQSAYVMMRPQEHEMPLPARVFRWRGYEDGPEVVAFRLASAYQTAWGISLEHLQASLTELPLGIEETMCFVGIGDHGGGPTERQIAWCRENADSIPDARLVFSTPSRFFEAIAPHVAQLPIVTGELQQHAIGCYSVHRAVKVSLRRAEHLLKQAESLATEPEAERSLNEAWQRVCFHHFHDTLGGTCLPSAYRQVEDGLGAACAVADEILQLGLRRRLAALSDDALARMVFFNASDAPCNGYVECEPWIAFETGWQSWGDDWRVLDESGAPVPFQLLQPEALHSFARTPRLLLSLDIPAQTWRVLRIERQGNAPTNPRVEAAPAQLRSDGGATWTPDALHLGAGVLPLPRLELIADSSDTWSHGLDRYPEEAGAAAQWQAPQLADTGPLMASAVQAGRIGNSELRAEWRVYGGEPFVELLLRVGWSEFHKLLKLRLDFPSDFTPLGRTDGIPGGQLARESDGRELPLRDWTLPASGSQSLGIVCPDIFALDATQRRVRLTLLRSALLAHHEPHSGQTLRPHVSDRGEHKFRFRFFGSGVAAHTLEAHALLLQRPPLFANLTRGMPPL